MIYFGPKPKGFHWMNMKIGQRFTTDALQRNGARFCDTMAYCHWATDNGSGGVIVEFARTGGRWAVNGYGRADAAPLAAQRAFGLK